MINGDEPSEGFGRVSLERDAVAWLNLYLFQLLLHPSLPLSFSFLPSFLPSHLKLVKWSKNLTNLPKHTRSLCSNTCAQSLPAVRPAPSLGFSTHGGVGGTGPPGPLTGFLALWPLFGVPRQGWRGRHPPAFPMQPHDTRTPSSYPQPRLLATGHIHLAVLCCIQGLSLPSATTARGGAGSPGSQPLGAPPNSRDTSVYHPF